MSLLNPAELEVFLGAVRKVNYWLGSDCSASGTPRTSIALLREVALAAVAAPATAAPAPVLQAYDPNIIWAKHIVEITYMQWDYCLSVQVEIGGNVKGSEILECAISTHADELFEAQGEDVELELRRPGAGDDTLKCSADGDDLEDFLGRLCVGLRIVRHEREER